jgi:hypothetical protein
MSKIALQDERGFNQIFAPVGSTLLRMRRRNDWFVDQINRLGARRVLELGSGTGETAAYLASLSDTPPPFGKFDMVCGNGILHHLVVRLPMVLRALHALTNPGGGLAFIEPNFLNPYCAFIFGTRVGRRWARLEPDEMAFTPGELRRALPAAGWQDVLVASRDFLVPGLPERLVGPIQAVEPALEATVLTRWLAQSHFFTARA